MLANSIFDDLITNLLSAVWILIEILSRDHVKGTIIKINNLKFGTFIGNFGSDGMASMAVKGLIITLLTHVCMAIVSHSDLKKLQVTGCKKLLLIECWFVRISLVFHLCTAVCCWWWFSSSSSSLLLFYSQVQFLFYRTGNMYQHVRV